MPKSVKIFSDQSTKEKENKKFSNELTIKDLALPLRSWAFILL
jgi:hypothetical protein